MDWLPPTRSKPRSCRTRSSCDLRLVRELADLVEEDGPPVGQLEAAELALQRRP